ncbi:unnamed protein product, partial [Rotaria socialis]
AAFMSKISAKISNAQPANRRPQIPPITRVGNNNSTEPTSPSARLQSAGDALRRTASTSKFNQPIIDKNSTHSTPPSAAQKQTSTQQPTNNNINHSANSLEEMSLSFMKVSSVKSTLTTNEQQQNGNKKKVMI